MTASPTAQRWPRSGLLLTPGLQAGIAGCQQNHRRGRKGREPPQFLPPGTGRRQETKLWCRRCPGAPLLPRMQHQAWPSTKLWLRRGGRDLTECPRVSPSTCNPNTPSFTSPNTWPPNSAPVSSHRFSYKLRRTACSQPSAPNCDFPQGAFCSCEETWWMSSLLCANEGWAHCLHSIK